MIPHTDRRSVVAYSMERMGWCVFRPRVSDLGMDFIAGPFATRERAERYML